MSPRNRKILNQVRNLGGAVVLGTIFWIFIDPNIQKPIDVREILLILFGLPAGAAALAVQIDRKSEI